MKPQWAKAQTHSSPLGKARRVSPGERLCVVHVEQRKVCYSCPLELRQSHHESLTQVIEL